MIGRKGIATAQPLEPHRGAELLRELDQRAHGAGPRDIVARDDGRARRRQQQPGHGGDACRIGPGRGKGMAGRAGGNGGLLLHDIDGQGHEYRPGRRLVGDLEGALQDRAQLIGRLDLHAPLGDGGGDGREIVAEHGIAQAEPRILLARGHDHRRVVLERAVDHADGIAEAGRHVKVHESRLAARLGIEVRGTCRHALVQMHDVLDLRIVEQRVEQRALGGAGIAEDAIDAVIEQRLEEYLTTAHGIISLAISQQSVPCY